MEFNTGSVIDQHKSVALINNFADPEKTSQELKLSGAINVKSLIEQENPIIDDRTSLISSDEVQTEFIPGMTKWLTWSKSDYQKYLNSNDVPINIAPEEDFCYLSNLLIYSYNRCDVTRIPKVKPTENYERLSHFAMNGSSIFPPLMLCIQPNDRIYNACSSPGGKRLLLLQTLIPFSIVCNDIDLVRANKIRTAFKQFLVDYESEWKNKRIFITTKDARDCSDYGFYDKILVAVSCTTDRHALKKFKNNNMLLPARSKELITIPELQTEILSNCIKLLTPGGSLVYSTCTFSPVQNDGVVHMAITKAYKENDITVTIKDLNNFGPLYLSKITRNR